MIFGLSCSISQIATVLEPGGTLALVVPYKLESSDRLRDYTPFSDLLLHYLRDDR
jgi:hypothetical protein